MLGEGKMFTSDNETLMKDLKALSLTSSLSECKKEIQQLKEKIQNLEEKIQMKDEIINLMKVNRMNQVNNSKPSI